MTPTERIADHLAADADYSSRDVRQFVENAVCKLLRIHERGYITQAELNEAHRDTLTALEHVAKLRSRLDDLASNLHRATPIRCDHPVGMRHDGWCNRCEEEVAA